MDESSIYKVFVVKDGKHTYYVQEMPGSWGMGRDYAVMKDRKRLYAGRFDSKDKAVTWLLKHLLQERNQTAIIDLIDL